jgi:hypothetical protein
MATRFNNLNLPFTLAFHGTFNYVSFVKEVWKNNRGEANLLAEIGENAPVDLHFYVEHESDLDEEAYISIETSFYSENEVQELKTFPLHIKHEDNRHVNTLYADSKKSGDYPWRLGRYGIRIFYKGRNYTTYFNVIPLHLESSEVLWMHDYLENSIEGIIYDFIYSQKARNQTDYGEMSAYWYFDYSKFIYDNKEKIVYALLQMEKNPSSMIVSEYLIATSPKKIGPKSHMWANSGKGMARNRGMQPQIYYNNKQKHETNITKENQWLKNILLLWGKDLNAVLIALKKDYDKLTADFDQTNSDLVNYQEQKIHLSGKKDVARHLTSHVSTVLRIKRESLQRYLHYKKIYEEQLRTLTLVKYRISYLINSSFLSDVPRGKIRPLLKARPYRLLDELYNESLKMKKEEGDKTRIIPILKQTWKVFEYFSLFKVLETFKDNGYVLTDGMDKNFINIYNQEGIPEGRCFVLEKEDSVIHVFYDKYLAVSEKEANERGEKFYASLDNKRPDIKIDAYKKKDDGSLWFNSSFVFDAKYRRRSSIYQSNYLMSSHSQLQNYYSVFYFGDNRLNNNMLCVDSVCCLYTKDPNSPIKDFKHPVTYIQLYPNIDEETGKVVVVGERELKNVLDTWLEGIQ